MQSAREDFVAHPADGDVADGCRVLFLYYLMMQLKYGVDQIVRTGGPTVGDAYRALKHTDDDPFWSRPFLPPPYFSFKQRT